MDKPLELFREMVVAELQALAAERPDYVYLQPVLGVLPNGDPDTRCAYFDPVDKTPSCVIGHLLARHGVGADDLVLSEPVEYKGMRYTDLNTDAGVRVLAHAGVIEIDRLGVEILEDVQVAQDCGIPWGQAVQSALGQAGAA